MNPNSIKRSLRLFALALLALAGCIQGFAQASVSLTAQRMTLPLPDGKISPMWGFCTTPPGPATVCSGQWAPGPTITVPYGQSLTISLTNNLPTPTSIVILGQVGGPLGAPAMDAATAHATKTQTTWPANGTATTPFVPPIQGQRVRSFGTETGAGFSTTYSWPALTPGTYLYETGTYPSIQAPMGLYGVVVVTQAPDATTTPLTPGQAYPGSYAKVPAFSNVAYDADAVLLLSEIDIWQNTQVDKLAAVASTSSPINPAAYPPAVNYAPTYFLMNGQPFNRTIPTSLPVAASLKTGNVLLRFVNAGLGTHVPSVVGLNMQLVAEDGNVLPGNPKVQSEVLLPAGKTYDVLVNPALTTDQTAFGANTYGIFDRQLSLSAGNTPDSGIYAFLQVANGALPSSVTPQAVADNFTVPSNVQSFSGNVLVNDISIHNPIVSIPPATGTVVLNLDGSFTYTGSLAAAVSFTYCGNGSTTLCAPVTITPGTKIGGPTGNPDFYSSKIAGPLTVKAPGVLGNDIDPGGFVLTAKADPSNALPAGVTLNSDGSFTVTDPTISGFSYIAVNSQGLSSTSTAVTLSIPAKGSGLTVSLIDAQTKQPIFSAANADYRWTIEEDTTYKNDAAINSATTPSTLAVNFHKSYMPVVATGCVGLNLISCGSGQTSTDPNFAMATPVDPSLVYLDPSKHYYISVLPGDAANAFNNGNATAPSAATCTKADGTNLCGHTMGGATIDPGQNAVTILVEPNPLPTAQLSIYIFNDNNPTNGDIDGVEESQGLGSFQIILNDVAGKTGDPIGQMTYDAFNMPLTNALMGTPDCPAPPAASGKDPSLQGMVLTCPAGSALAGHALIKNLMPGRFDVIANPPANPAANIKTGVPPHWVQTSTLEGTRGQDAFTGVGEPAYFQEFGPPGFHSFIGFIDTNAVEARHATLTAASKTPTNTIKGQIVNEHMSRPTDESLHAGSHDPLSISTCYVGLNSQSGTGENIAFSRCDDKGNFTIAGVPDGAYQLVHWDEWLDQIIDYQLLTVTGGQTLLLGPIQTFSWFTRLETNTFLDDDGTHLPGKNPGIAQVPFTVRFRDGSFSNVQKTDANGNATFNELFPLFNWYVIESDTTRFKGTQVHVVVDGGGKVDGPLPDGNGTMATPSGSNYQGILNSHYPTGESTERFDPGTTFTEGLQGYISQTQVTDWGKTEFKKGENGGINGTVVYASTRPFDDPKLLIQNLWEPLVPHVTVRLYQEFTAPDGTQGLQFINESKTSSWDDSVSGGNGYAAMNCPGQISNGTPPAGDPFVGAALGVGNEKKCYDGFHNWNQVQPAAYDGRYRFTTLADGVTPLPDGKYVVEMVMPNGYELVKEEDKNILIGDAFIAPASQQFGSLANIFILPDQATVGEYNNNPNNPNNATTDMGHPSDNLRFPTCIGTLRRVPNFLSLFPVSGQVAPFAGADRNLCDRKEVFLNDQMQANADFFVFTSAHIASHFTGIILDDASAEFNTASPDFGEKASVPYVPVSIRDWKGNELSRLHSDQYGTFNGLTPSSWEVNVPNPAGYSPNMLTTCMNDPGPISDGNGGLITDPQYNPNYSIFCYDNPFMPGLTDYLDTPLLPVAAFAAGYNPADCSYPDATPAIRRVDTSAGHGPWLAPGVGTVTLTSMGIVSVPNPNYAGPISTTATSNPAIGQKSITRNYGFGTSQGQVLLNGVALVVTSWGDSSITATVPAGSTTGELSVVAANGNSTVDGITLTIEAQTATSPKRITPTIAGGDIQAAIDAASPGDLILLDAGSYNELAIMSKPVRIQGVGAPSVIINATKYPTNKLENWRPKINTLFGIDAAGNQTLPALVDPLPGEAITGGIVLLEPSVLGAEEGAGITVLAKNLGSIPGEDRKNCSRTVSGVTVYNFACYKSRIDGISVTGGDSGGGIFVHGYAHNIEISNNRVFGNAGAYNGGVRVGVPYLEELALTTGKTFGFAFNNNVKIHNNAISSNGTVEANTGAGGAGGGLSLCTGSDNYQVTSNFVCGNFSTGDGGGIGHIGVSLNGLISKNTVRFNQSFAQGATVHGGGIIVEGEPAAAGGALSLGAGNVVIDSNLVQGNFAEVGNGGGIRLQDVNGAEINRGVLYKVTVINNMVTNNVAGTAGGGISMVDTVNSIVNNNTIVSNDSVGISGALFGVGGSALTSSPHVAGVATEPTSSALQAALNSRSLLTGNKIANSNPDLNNNIIWQNRSFFFDGSTGTDNTCSSKSRTDATGHNCNILPAQTTPGQCVGTPAYWDLGVVSDTTPTPNVNILNPTNSILTSTIGYSPTNLATQPQLVSQYCNGGRGLPSPLHIFQIAASAVEDEGGNFVDLRYGPLTPTGDYRITSTSPAIDAGSTDAPNHDFFGTPRPQNAAYDIGAMEYPFATATLLPNLLAFGNVPVNTTSSPMTATFSNTGVVPFTINSIILAGTGNANFGYSTTCTTGVVVPVGGTCTISVTFTPTVLQTRTVTLTVNSAAGPQQIVLTGSGVLPGTLAPLADFGTVQVGQASSPQSSTFTNISTSPLTIGNIGFVTGNAANFGQTNNCLPTVAANASCTINVTFAPNAIGLRASNLQVQVQGVAGAVTTPVSGTGANQSETLSALVDFGSVPLTASSASQAATFKNTGFGPVSITIINFTGNNPTNFTQTNNCPATVPVNGSCAINVSFAPNATGSRTANLHVSVAGIPGGLLQPVSGTGATAAVAATLSPTTFGFGTGTANNTKTPVKNFLFTNNSGFTITMGSIGNLGGTTPGQFFVVAGTSTPCTLGQTLAAGATCNVGVQFGPSSTGHKVATLTVANTTASTTANGLTGN